LVEAKKRLSLVSSDGGIRQILKTPPRNTVELLSSSGDSPISQRSLASTPTHSRPASRRGSRCEHDTKNRLFGPAENSPRRVKNLFQSKIFDSVDSPCVTKIAATKAVSTYTPIRRNPITGEICAIQSPSRSNSVLLKKPITVNNGNNSSSLPVTPTFNRNNITTISTNGTNTNNLSNSSIASSCLSINSNSSSSLPSQ